MYVQDRDKFMKKNSCRRVRVASVDDKMTERLRCLALAMQEDD